jgi:GLPGLI family protein
MKLLLFSVALVCCLSASAQQADIAVGKATYDFTHVRDTTKRDKPYKERLILLLGRNASVYKSLDKQLAQEAMLKQVAEQFKAAPNPNAVELNIKGAPATQAEEFYQYTRDKKLYIEEKVVNYYLTEEPLPAIKWLIKKDTLSFGALHCQKATTHFKGRDYEAWFCPDLPFQKGPWKLNGLPGLILEACDSKKEVVFKFAGFEDISASKQTILPPADDIRVTRADIDRLKETRKKDPAAFANAARSAGQAKRGSDASPAANLDVSKIKSINITAANTGDSRVVNNPIELPERK